MCLAKQLFQVSDKSLRMYLAWRTVIVSMLTCFMLASTVALKQSLEMQCWGSLGVKIQLLAVGASNCLLLAQSPQPAGSMRAPTNSITASPSKTSLLPSANGQDWILRGSGIHGPENGEARHVVTTRETGGFFSTWRVTVCFPGEGKHGDVGNGVWILRWICVPFCRSVNLLGGGGVGTRNAGSLEIPWKFFVKRPWCGSFLPWKGVFLEHRQKTGDPIHIQ